MAKKGTGEKKATRTLKIGRKRIRITKRVKQDKASGKVDKDTIIAEGAEQPQKKEAGENKKLPLFERLGFGKNKNGKNGAAVGKNGKPAPTLAVKILIIVAAVAIIGMLVGLGLGLTWGAQAPALDTDKFTYSSATTVYDANGNYYQELQSTEKREPVTIDKIPEMVQLAFVSIEDQRFFQHSGVDIRGTLKAIFGVLTTGSTDGPGGSTITQQLIKQTHLTSATSIKRKVMEWKLAYQLEKVFTKRQILEAYLNKVNLSYAWGIQSASKLYFNKDVSQLDVAQAAVLASIINSPTYYNPYDYETDEAGNEYLKKITNEDGSVTIAYDPANMERSLLVIEKMYQLGHICEEEYNIAKDEIENNKIALVEPANTGLYTYFTDAVYAEVLEDLMEKYNYRYDDAVDLLLNGGLRIYATIDPIIQNALDAQAADPGNFPESSYAADAASAAMTASTGEPTSYIPQVGGVVIENETGQVKGIIGGREKKGSLTMNRALEKFQTGSSTKPLTAYAPGLDTGVITLASTFDDVALNFGGWVPANAESGSGGMTTVRKGLTESINRIAVQAEMKTGHEVSAAYAEKFGLEIDRPNDLGAAALALGGYTYGQTPLAMASAFSVFPNGGYRYTPTFYTKVTDSNNVTILTSEQQMVQVISDQVAWLVTDVLKGVVTGGTTNISVSGQDLAGKTGTTDSRVCAWFCGFTPKYSGAFWFGYDVNNVTVNGETYELRVGLYGGDRYNGPAGFFEDVFNQFYAERGEPAASFKDMPAGIFAAAVDGVSGKAPTELTGLDPRGSLVISEYFADGTYPSESDDMHQYVELCAVSGGRPNEYCPVVRKVMVVKDYSKLYPAGVSRVNPFEIPASEAGAIAPQASEVCTLHNAGTVATGFSFSTSNANVDAGDTVNISGVPITASGGAAPIGDSNYSVSVGNSSVASAVCSGQNITITGVSPGTTTLTFTGHLNVGTTKEYTITGTVNITVSAAVVYHDISISVNDPSKGTATISANTVTDGGSVIVTCSPSAGYTVDTIVVNGVGVVHSGNTCTITGITENKDIVVTFIP